MTMQISEVQSKSVIASTTTIVCLTILAAVFTSLFIPVKYGPQRVLADQHEPADAKRASGGETKIIGGTGGLFFEANQGQFDKRVKFSARASGYKLFLTSNEAVYVIHERGNEAVHAVQPGPGLSSPDTPKSRGAVAVWMKLAGANRNPEAVGVAELAGKHNYFRGADPSKWQSNVPLYQKALLNNVYDGIDMEWYGNGSRIEYDFKVSPNVSTRQIEWRIDGADKVSVEDDGSLVISTPFGELKQYAPVTYQESDGLRTAVESRFEKRGENSVGFAVGDYDHSRPLTIDPVTDLNYSTFLGGELGETGFAIADGAQFGGVYVTGATSSTLFPTTPGTYNDQLGGGGDVFVSKFNDEGSALIYSTYIGGGSNDAGYGIAIDSLGNAYITGATAPSAIPFPTTVDAPFPNNSGDMDAFVTKLNPTGSALVYSTLSGGALRDEGLGITVRAGRAYVAGFTQSSNFPTTAGAFDTTLGGLADGFVMRVGPQGFNFEYSTLIGGSDVDIARGIAVDGSGNAIICGESGLFSNHDYPTTPGAFDRTHNGEFDAVVTKFNPAGSALVYSTLLGGDNREIARAIAIDPSGSVYITGETSAGSVLFPTTPGAFDTTFGGSQDVFVTKFNPAGSALVYSTFLGGDDNDTGHDIEVNAAGNAFVTGRAGVLSVSYPTTAAAYDTRTTRRGVNDFADAFLTKLTASGGALIYSTFIGSSNPDWGNGIALNSSGDAFLTGYTSNGDTDFPTTAGAFQPDINGFSDAFVSKFVATSNLPIVRAPFDFDGDGKTDVGIFRPAAAAGAEWWYQRSSDLQVPALQFGASTDKIAPADFSGDGRADIAFWRPSTGEWFVLRSEDNSYFAFPFGTNGDVPAPADYDGDGKGDIAVFRPSNATWYITRSSGGTTIQQFGASSDRPVTADYDGDGRSDIAIFRPGPGEWWIQQSSNGQVAVAQFGSGTDRAVPGDYTGDGKADVAFWRPSTGYWTILRSEDLSFFSAPFGASGDAPAPGDYDGDGKFDLTVFRPSSATWYIQRSTAGTSIVAFGATADIPVASAFVR